MGGGFVFLFLIGRNKFCLSFCRVLGIGSGIRKIEGSFLVFDFIYGGGIGCGR